MKIPEKIKIGGKIYAVEKTDRLDMGSINYSGEIDLDANGMETEYQAAFDDLLWFVNAHLANTGAGNFDGVDVNIIFNKDVLINETESVENCQKSVGILSDETIVS